ncbi:MAG: M48 family metalloprotease [Bacteroidales bacterium]|nr:M48 family metalloprotease [Bacteroidales bacterium]
MKKLLIFMLCMLCISVSHAKNNNKEFIKIIKAHDVSAVAKELPESAEEKDFWLAVLNNNPITDKFAADIQKGKGAEKQALEAYNRMRAYNYKADVEIVEDLRGFCDTLVMDMGLPAHIFELNVILDPTPNAFAVLTNDGFAICLNSGLFDALEYDYLRIMAVTAHEFAHGAFFHHIRKEYEVAKKERKDKILGGIATGLTAASAGLDAYTAGLTGQEYDSSVYEKRIAKIADDMKQSSIKFRYKYGRESELEADLAAIRFMQFIGHPEKYIEALQMISSSPDYFWADEDSDHPSTAYRVEFLNFAIDNPQYGYEVKTKQLTDW